MNFHTSISTCAEWLLDKSLEDAGMDQLFQGCCERLLESGIPLRRSHISYSVLHPLYFSKGLLWRDGKALEQTSYVHSAEHSEDWLQSPLYHMIVHRLTSLRRRLEGTDAELDFPVLHDFSRQGLTDYLAFLVKFDELNGEPRGMVGSWSTDAPGGFTPEQVQQLVYIQKHLGIACKISVNTEIARNVANAYLGETAGLEVLTGRIKRGDYRKIRAVIWMSDMRESTRLAEELPTVEYMELLNTYFEYTARPLVEAGGQVLGFIGDAVLGIFPVNQDSLSIETACRQALAAAHKSIQLMQDGPARLNYGIALNCGDVEFGNIGIPERLSFTAIGPAVNEVTRVESLTRQLNQPILVTDRFAELLPIDWHNVGKFELKGVQRPVTAYAPPVMN